MSLRVRPRRSLIVLIALLVLGGAAHAQATRGQTEGAIRWAQQRYFAHEFRLPESAWEEWCAALIDPMDAALLLEVRQLRIHQETVERENTHAGEAELGQLDLGLVQRMRRELSERLQALEPLLTLEASQKANELSAQGEKAIEETGIEWQCFLAGLRDRERWLRLYVKTMTKAFALSESNEEFRRGVIREIRSAYRLNGPPDVECMLEYEKPFSLNATLALLARERPEVAQCLEADGVTSTGDSIRWTKRLEASGKRFGVLGTLLEEIATTWARDLLDSLRVDLRVAERVSRCQSEEEMEEAHREVSELMRNSKRWGSRARADKDVAAVAAVLREICSDTSADDLLVHFAKSVAPNSCGGSWLERSGRAWLESGGLDDDAKVGVEEILKTYDEELRTARLEFAASAMRIRAMTDGKERDFPKIEALHDGAFGKIWRLHEAALAEVRALMAAPTRARFALDERRARFKSPREFGKARIHVAHGLLQEEQVPES